MSGVVSAIPEKLIHYSDVAREIDANLQSKARHLQAQLEHFEARCVEPDFRISVSGQAHTMRQYANQCEPVDMSVREVGRQFQLADGQWGYGGTTGVRGWISKTWTTLRTDVSSTVSGAVTGLVNLISTPGWLRSKVTSLSWTAQNYSEWMPDITKSLEFLGRYIAEHLNVNEADFDPLDVALFLFSKTPLCSDSLRNQLDNVDDLKTAYGLVATFNKANFMFFMAGILSNPERYIDPWLDKVNRMTLFTNKPINSGTGPTNLHGRDMSEMPQWMKMLFGRTDEVEARQEVPGSVLGVSTVYAGEKLPDSASASPFDLTGKSLVKRRELLEKTQADIDTLNQALANLRSLGANDQMTSDELEQQIATLRQRQADLRSQTDDWRNKIRVSEQGLKGGFDDGILDAPWRTRADDFESEIERLSEKIAGLEDRLPYQREFDRTLAQLQTAEHTKQSIETSLAEHWWNDVPVHSQQDLSYKGQDTAYGCAPTATAMVLDYWHSQDPNNKTMPAQELLNINVRQGEFSATGMSVTHIHDEVKNLGYNVPKDYMNSDFETLKSAVEQGPVISMVKLNLAATGWNHSVVVTGISPDGAYVRINDPWTGESHSYKKSQFMKSWGADFGVGKSRRNFTVICPQKSES
jgi:predicted double-glycine peptidase